MNYNISMKNILLIITLFVSWNAFAEEKVWYCVAEHSSGLKHNGNFWETGDFELPRMTVIQKDNSLKFSGHDLGFFDKICRSGFLKNLISCADSSSTIFTLNKKTGLATSASTYGWLTSFPKENGGGDTLSVSLWRCDSF